eukprot:scaffold228663_cov18-Tisochrysis_lutea.AAC.5
MQEAAGLYAFIQEAEANKVDAPKPQDLSADCLSVMEKLMLAQGSKDVSRPAPFSSHCTQCFGTYGNNWLVPAVQKQAGISQAIRLKRPLPPGHSCA